MPLPRYIFRYFIWSLVFTLVVKYTKHMSSNTCAFRSCDWTTCKTRLYPSRVSLEAVSSGTRYTWSNIIGLEAVFSINIFLHSFVASLLFASFPFKTCSRTKGSCDNWSCKKKEWTVWSFASVKNQNVKTNFVLTTKKI